MCWEFSKRASRDWSEGLLYYFFFKLWEIIEENVESGGVTNLKRGGGKHWKQRKKNEGKPMDDEKDECKEGRKLAVDFDLLNVLNTEVGRLNSKWL